MYFFLMYCNKFTNVLKRYSKFIEKIFPIISPSFPRRDWEESIRALDPIKVFLTEALQRSWQIVARRSTPGLSGYYEKYL